MSNENYPNNPPEMPRTDPYAPHPNYSPYAPPAGPTSFIEHLHTVGGSGLFLVGIILFTAGTLLTMIVSFSIFTIFPLILAALPITGFWLIFAASKNPRLPEKTLPALTLFKIHTIFGLVVVSLVALLVLVVMLLAFIGAAAVGDTFALVPLLLVSLLMAIIFVVIILFYYVAILKIINSIRENIVNNTMNPLRGVMSFTVITLIAVAFGILFSFIGLAVMGAMGATFDFWIDELMWELMWYAPELAGFGIENMLRGLVTTMTLSLVFSLVTYTGYILLIVSLNKLAGVVKR